MPPQWVGIRLSVTSTVGDRTSAQWADFHHEMWRQDAHPIRLIRPAALRVNERFRGIYIDGTNVLG
jgi:hypothetical protein